MSQKTVFRKHNNYRRISDVFVAWQQAIWCYLLFTPIEMIKHHSNREQTLGPLGSEPHPPYFL